MTEEAWTSHPAVRQILSRLLDMLDAQPLQVRKRTPGFRLTEDLVPEFYGKQAGDRDFVWGLFRKAQQRGLFTIRLEPSKGPGYADYERSPRVTLAEGAELQIRQLLGRTEPVISGAEAWRKAVLSTFSGPNASKQFLIDQTPLRVEGRSFDEVVAHLNRLYDLEGSQLFLREVSSRLFWGLSKVLDNRAPLVAGLFGVAECPFPEAPVQLQIHVAHGDCTGVLFIENQTPFEAARRGRYPEAKALALIQSAGFRAGAKRLRTLEGSSLYYSSQAAGKPGTRDRLEAWFYKGVNLPVFFWGDLDYSGMAILRELKAVFPNLVAWQPGYAPMVARLEAGTGHLPEEAGKERQLDPGVTGCAYADQVLLPAIRLAGRFVDQE